MITHLWQSTVVAGIVWIATLALRQNGARVRYWLWLAASVKFLVPLSGIVWLGAQIEWRNGPSNAQPVAAFVIDQMFAPPIAGTAIPTAVAESSNVPAAALGIWLAGAMLVCLWWWRQWIPVRAACRAARRLPRDVDSHAGLTVMSSSMTMEPGVVGIWRPVLLVPEGLLDHLTAPQRDALFAHERSHVRHRDNLTAAVHMAVEALFWFHPIVWWIERRLIDERERACDEEVLRSGSQPTDYAESILVVCRLCVGAPLACVAGVTGSNLRRRIESILRGTPGRPMSASRRVVLTLTAVAALALPMVVGTVNAVPLITVGQDLSAPVAFDVASVKVNKSGALAAEIDDDDPGGRFTARNVLLRRLITYAYQISDNQLVSAPGWIGTERFDITARLDHEPPAVPRSEPGERRLALRTLLAERFQLVVKREMREVPMYALVMARADRRLGPMLVPSSTDCSPEALKTRIAAGQAGTPVSGVCGTRANAGRIQFGGYPMSEFVKVFRPNGRSVVDRTGLTGNWELQLTYLPDQFDPATGQNASAFDPDLPSLPTALEEQLGLKLESIKGTIEVLVIERVERPTGN